MKRKLQTLCMAALMLSILPFAMSGLFAQAPDLMSYQAVIRNANNNLVVNASIGMKVSILQGSSTGTAVYVETHAATSNANGLVTVQIGSGTAVTGTLASIDWSAGPYFIKTETDPAGGTSYSITSTSQLLSVPFALFAKSSGSSTPGPAGPTGAQGVPGADGVQGPTGADGAQGATGADGAQGPSGTDGAQGPTGADGAQGPTGADGAQGPTGADGAQGPTGLLSVNCLECHNHDHGTGSGYEGSMAQKRDRNKEAYKYSAHGIRLHHFYAGQNAGCAHCHSNEGFISRVQNNAQPTYTYNSSTGKYSYSFNAPASASSSLPSLPGRISCFTCHKGAASDSMAMALDGDSVGLALWAMPQNAKFGKIPQDQKSLTCLACHQARPVTYNSSSGDGSNVLDSLLVNLSNVIYDSTKTASTGNIFSPGYRSGGHYGWPGNIFLGVGYGPAEIPGSATYENSSHSSQASCVMCHMATPTANSSNYYSGGHTFIAENSFKGCNANSACHTNMSATHTSFTATRTLHKALLDTLGDLLTFNGMNLMMIDSMPFVEDHYATHSGPEGNMWHKFTTKHFNGYFNIYDATYNPGTNTFKASNTSTSPYSKYPSITKGHLACMLIFQACVREYSGGVHNPKYTKALLTNAIEYMRANPVQ